MGDEIPTVGVEEEFLLVDPRTGAPVGRNCEVARIAGDFGVDLQLELTACQVETSTAVHTDSRSLASELSGLRAVVSSAARAAGTRLMAVATPPTVPDAFPVTDTPRYRRIAERFGMLAHEQGICGAHVHVGVPDRETAVQVSNYLRPWLPALLALTANSAFYRNSVTGFASWRSILWRRWASAGPPPYFRSAGDYDAMVEMMLSTGAILDEHMAYWDVRPSSRYPTVEVRVSDVPATAEETVLLAQLVRGVVLTARQSLQQGRIAIDVPTEQLHAAYWTAARHGMSGKAMDLRNGHVVPARAILLLLVDHVRDALDSTGDRTAVETGLDRLVRTGNGAIRQVRAYRKRHDIADVVTEIASATCADPPDIAANTA